MTDHQDLSRLRHELQAMSSGGPAVPDWTHRVRRGVRSRRRRKGLAFGALGVVAMLSIGTAGVYALGGTADDRVTVAGPSDDPAAPTAAPGSSACAPEAPLVQPTLPAPKLDQSPINDIRLTLTPNCTRPRVGDELVIYPPSNSQTITIRVLTPEPAVVGRPWPITVSASGLADREPFLQVRFDDEDKLLMIYNCAATDSSPPPATVQHTKQSFQHVFQTPGRHEVQLRADSACSYYQGEETLTVVVDVAPAQGGVEPAASPTP